MAIPIGVQSSFIAGDGRPLLEPGALFVDGNYSLRLNAWANTNVTLALRSRFLRSDDGQLVDSGDQLVPAVDRSRSSVDIALATGFPLNVQVFATVGPVGLGLCFVQVQIVRGTGPASFPLATILQGYITATNSLSWPGSPIQNSLDGAGGIVALVIGPPGAGAEQSLTIPTNARRLLLSFDLTFTASGAAGNRNPSLAYDNGVSTYLRSPYGQNIAAGGVVLFTWMQGFGAQVAAPNGRVGASLPVNTFLLAGYHVKTETAGLLGGDVWSGANVSMQEWLDI